MRHIAQYPRRQGRAWLAQFGALALTLAVASLLELPLAATKIAEADPPPPPSELLQFRTQSSRTFDNHDGTYTTALHSGPVHYRDGQGQWRPISSALVPSNESGYGYENGANRFRTYFKSTLANDYLALDAGGERFRLTLQNAAQVSAQAGARKITYPGVFPGVDLRYDLRPDGLKETLLLQNAQAQTSFRFLFSPPASARVHAARLRDGSWAFFSAPHARPVFVIDAPWAAEDDEPRADRRHASLAVTRIGDAYALDLGVDTSWLRAPGRQFPVRLDPTIAIQPAIQDASFDFGCPACGAVSSDRLSIGTDGLSTKWRSALQFSLSDIPAGASVSSAKLKLYFDGTCLPGAGSCGGTAHTMDALRMTSSWAVDSKTSELAFDTTPLTSFTLPASPSPQWMSWTITSTVQNWVAGTQSNFGLLLKRATEPPAASGPKPPSRNYAAEPTLGPTLEVTYNGDGGELLEPETVHSDGGELRWIPYSGPGAPPFSSYEVHRSPNASFTPSLSTRLARITDANQTTFRDTSAKAGATFTYKVVVSGAETNPRTVTLPASGQARKTLRPDSKAGLDTYITQRSDSLDCANRGANERLKVGTDAISIWRSLLRFDLVDIPASATVTDATLSLWHPETTTAALTVRAHRGTGDWQEGSGIAECSGDGATWYELTGGLRWAQDGGDYDPAIAASLAIPSDSPAGWSQWSLTSLVRQWVAGTSANMGVLFKLDDETRIAGKSVDFYASDFGVAPSLRPKLAITYADGSSPVAPSVTVTKPVAGTQVSGTAVTIAASAFDDRRVDSVQFFVDGNAVGTDTSAPFSITWNSTTVSNGSHNVTARATDDAGNETTSAAVAITVGNSAAPTTSITSPTGGSVTGNVTVTANANDDVAVTKVEFYADDLLFATDTSSPYSASWNTLDPALPAYDGLHTLTTRAYDAHAQVTTSAPVTVSVENTAATMYRAGFSSTQIPIWMEHKPTPPAQQYPVDVTVTNQSTSIWSNLVLRYRWYGDDPAVPLPGGGEAAVPMVLPSGSVPVHLDVVPPALAAGIARGTYRLRFDLYDPASASYFAARGNKPLEADVVVGVPEWEQRLGIEPYFHYEREELGLGMTSLLNVATGNHVIHWTPFQAPGRGLSTVVNLTHNVRDRGYNGIVGKGWSLAISSLTRLGSGYDFNVPTSCSVGGNQAVLIDADGTRHPFEMVDGTDCDSARWKPPAGVHLYLRNDGGDGPGARWMVTRPDRVTYVYDGQQSSSTHRMPLYVEDGNGNRITFGYDNHSPRRVNAVTDQGGRSFSLTYFNGGSDPCRHDDKVKTISDHSDTVLEFCYDGDGQLLRLTQHDGTLKRSFEFTHTDPLDADLCDQNGPLASVEDPEGRVTRFDYYGSEDKLCLLDDRDPRILTSTEFVYDDPNPDLRVTTVRKAAPPSETRVTVYRDEHPPPPPPPAPPVLEEGIIDSLTDPAGRVTAISWTNSRNNPPPPDDCPLVQQPLRHVWKVTAPANRTTRYCYNANGRPTKVTNPLSHKTEWFYLNLPADGSDTQNSISLLSEFRDPNTNPWLFRYDANNVNLEKVIDPDGTEASPFLRFAYHTGPPEFGGALASVTDANNNLATTYDGYDLNGFPTLVREAGVYETKYSFDEDGLLRWVRDPRHADPPPGDDERWYRTIFDYDGLHRRTATSTPMSTAEQRVIYTSASYDLNDNVLTSRQPSYRGQGPITTLAYDEMDRPTLITNPENEKTAFAYDLAGRLGQLTRPKGLLNPPPPPPPVDPNKDYSTEFKYDPLDRVVSELEYDADGVGTRRTHYCYDLAGDLRWLTAPRAELLDAPTNCPGGPVPAYTTRYDYDDAHRLSSVTEPLTATETRERTFQYDNNGNLRYAINENGTQTEFTYTRRNELEKRIEMFIEEVPVRRVTTFFAYDRAGNMIRQVSPRAWDTAGERDPGANGAYVTDYRYDMRNQLERIALPDTLGGDPRAYTHRRYDENGELVLTTLPVVQDELGTLCNTPNPHCTGLTRFDPGWIRTSTDNVNPLVTFDYTAEGWQRSRQACAAGRCRTTKTEYLADGLPRSVGRESNFEGRQGNASATYQYDENNNLKRADVVRSGGLTTSTVTADYNGYDEPTQVGHQQPPETQIRYTDSTYDKNGNVATRIDNRTIPGTGRKHVFTYDQADQLTLDDDWVNTTAGDVGDLQTFYEYELTGWDRLKTVKRLDSLPGNWQEKLVSESSYFANGDLKTLTNKTRRNGQLTTVEDHTLSYLEGSIYMNGHRVSDQLMLESPNAQCSAVCTTTYAYGPRDNVVSESNTSPSWPSRTWEYDAALNVISEAVAGQTKTFTYEGLRLKDERQNGQVVARYLYDVEGDLDCVVDQNWTPSNCPSAPEVGAGAPNASLIADYQWHFLGPLQRFRQFANPGAGNSVTYSHDALGRPVHETSTLAGQSRRTCFGYLGLTQAASEERRVGATDNCSVPPTVTKSYGLDADLERTVMKVTGGPAPGEYVYARNVHGDPSLLLKADDGSGARTGSYGYSAYGSPILALTEEAPQDQGFPFNPYRFNDRRLDPASGSSDMGARRYSSSMGAGRFLQSDSYEGAGADLGLSLDPLTMNRYAFAAGNPISFLESDGHEPWHSERRMKPPPNQPLGRAYRRPKPGDDRRSPDAGRGQEPSFSGPRTDYQPPPDEEDDESGDGFFEKLGGFVEDVTEHAPSASNFDPFSDDFGGRDNPVRFRVVSDPVSLSILRSPIVPVPKRGTVGGCVGGGATAPYVHVHGKADICYVWSTKETGATVSGGGGLTTSAMPSANLNATGQLSDATCIGDLSGEFRGGGGTAGFLGGVTADYMESPDRQVRTLNAGAMVTTPQTEGHVSRTWTYVLRTSGACRR